MSDEFFIAPYQVRAAGTDVPPEEVQKAINSLAQQTTADLNLLAGQVPVLPLPSGSVTYNEGGTGAITRTVTSKLQDVVSITDFGAVGDGATVNTTAIQNALNAGAKAVFVPAGTFVCGPVTLPNVVGFVLYGTGTASVLKQTGSATPMLSWNQSSTFYSEGYIRDLAFDGTNGGANTIDTTGVGGETLKNLYFNNVPTGFSSIYVNGAAATQVHDIRLDNIQIYSTTAGLAGVRWGPLTFDSTLSNMIMNGNFAVQYGIYYDSGATAIQVSDSHPYNTTVNIVLLNGSNNFCTFNNVVFDNSNGDLVSASGTNNLLFTNSYFENIASGHSGIRLSNTQGVTVMSALFFAQATAAAAITEVSGSDQTKVIGGSIANLGNFVTPFVFVGANSYGFGIAGYDTLKAGGPAPVASPTFTGIFDTTGQSSLAGAVGSEALRAVPTASAVNWVQVSGATTGNSPNISAQGSDSNITLALSSKGTFGLGFYTENFGKLQVAINDTASANRFLTLTGSNGANPTIGASAGNVAFSSAVQPSATLGIVGTTTNDNANAGSVGELITATGTSVSLPIAGTTTNITSISLTAGDWDVSGMCNVSSSNSTMGAGVIGISTTSATLGAIGTYSQIAQPSGTYTVINMPTPVLRFSLSGTTTVFLVASAAAGSGTASGTGVITARRRR